MDSLNKLGFKEINIDHITKAAWNYNEDEIEKADKLLENIRRIGQVENIIVRQLETGKYEVVNGNHRIDAFRALGIQNIVVYDLGKIDLPAAKRIAIETNETRFSVDSAKLSGIMNELVTDYTLGELFRTMPFTIDELEKLVIKDSPSMEANEISAENSESLIEFEIRIPNDVNQYWVEWRHIAEVSFGATTGADAFKFALIEAMKTENE